MSQTTRTAASNLQQTVAQHRQRQTERVRNPYTILIDEPPMGGQYVEVRDASCGSDDRDMLVRRVQPPITGKVILHFSDGRCRGAEISPGIELF